MEAEIHHLPRDRRCNGIPLGEQAHIKIAEGWKMQIVRTKLTMFEPNNNLVVIGGDDQSPTEIINESARSSAKFLRANESTVIKTSISCTRTNELHHAKINVAQITNAGFFKDYVTYTSLEKKSQVLCFAESMGFIAAINGKNQITSILIHKSIASQTLSILPWAMLEELVLKIIAQNNLKNEINSSIKATAQIAFLFFDCIKFMSQDNTDQKSNDNYCVLYVLSDDNTGHIKIGITSNLKERVKKIRNASGRDLKVAYTKKFHSTKQASVTERKLHKFFDCNRIGGEWFDVHLVTVIEKITHGL